MKVKHQKRYSVHVGGVVVSDHLMTLADAKVLALEFIGDGYSGATITADNGVIDD